MALALALAVGACTSEGGSAAEPAPDDEVLVFAAASLTDAVEQLGAAFRAERPASGVVLNLAGSQTLARQIVEGAAADVFVAADDVAMTTVADAGRVAGEPRDIATNRLMIAVEAGNPLGIDEVTDLARSDLVLVLPAEEVPAGRYARWALDRLGVSVRPSSLERDVRAALAKVVLGEADAAVVYASDVAAAGDDVDGVPIPEVDGLRIAYPAAVVADAPNPAGAEAFVTFLQSEVGQRILADHGLGAP